VNFGLSAAWDVSGDRRGGRFSEFLGDLGVDVHGERDRRVPEHLANHPGLDTGGQEHRGGTMTKVMEPEGIWSLLKRAMANFAAPGLDRLVRIVKRKLKKIQYRPHLIGGCLAATGLSIETW